MQDSPQLPVLAAFLLVALLQAVAPAAEADAVVELERGDRVVFVGNTLIERAQLYDFIELAFTTRFPDVTYRNLGWSGDTVYGEARAYFGSPEDGFNHLKEHVYALEPDVIIVGYGLNESYRGEEGLQPFTNGLNRLLDMLEQTDARIVLLSPLPHEQATSPLPDVSPANANVQLYSDTLADVAEQRNHACVNLYQLITNLEPHPDEPLTDNGIHLTARGYYHLAAALERGFGYPQREWTVHVSLSGSGDPRVRTVEGAAVELGLDDGGSIAFAVTDELLPIDQPSDEAPTWSNYLPPRVLRVSGLDAGEYQLSIDDHPVVTATAEQFARGIELHAGPPFEQAAELRQTILFKNELFFHKYRPQNETYIRGFRSHEQGQHAADLPKFDPHIEKQEARIDQLREPITHTYKLEAVE